MIAPADDDAPLPPYVISAGRAVPVPYNGSVARLSFGFLSASRVRRWVREGRFDVLHVHEPAVPSPGPARLLGGAGADRGHLPRLLRALPVALGRGLGPQSALEKITGRIAVSDAARKTLVEHMGGDAVLIPNGVTVSRYAEGEPLPGWRRRAR